MRIEGKVWRDGKFWVIALPALRFSTQALKESDVSMMMEDAVQTVMEVPRLKVRFIKEGEKQWFLEFEEPKHFVMFFLSHLRWKNRLSIEEVCQRLGFKSRSSYHQYETGRREPSIGQFEAIVKAISIDAWKALKVAA